MYIERAIYVGVCDAVVIICSAGARQREPRASESKHARVIVHV